MRRIILRMIATGSLSAFASAALQGPSGVGGLAGRGGVQPARATAAAPLPAPGLGAKPAPGSLGPVQGAPGVAPGKPLPRGSLLDLSV